MSNSFISVIIPCRNEEKFIGKCLDSLIEQNYPKESLEILVVDGASDDKTKEIIREFANKYPFIKLLENPQKHTPFGLNYGIKEAKGEIIIRMDAHAGYEKNYISECVKNLKSSGADNVGGIIQTLPARNTIVARAIAICLSHPFGAGGSIFRLGSRQKRWVDTVFGGCYWREVFDKIVLFDERLIRSQDIEFNKRLIKDGGKILLVPEIIARYYPHTDFFKFWKHNFNDGIWTTYPLRFKIRFFSLRHLLPLAFVLGLLGLFILAFFFEIFFFLLLFVAGLYFLVSTLSSLQVVLKEKDIRFLFVMPFVFVNRHKAYGLGSLVGLIKIII